jgi:hypothetical protein
MFKGRALCQRGARLSSGVLIAGGVALIVAGSRKRAV